MTEHAFVKRRRWPIVAPFAVVVILAAVWSGIWYAAARTAERSISDWIDREARNGRVYDCGSRSVGGYPFRIELRCTDPVAEIKSAPLVLKARQFLAVAQVYQPTLIIGEIVGPLSIGAPGQPAMVVSDWKLAQASLHLTPMPDRIAIAIDDARVELPGAAGTPAAASANHIELHVRIDPTSAPDKPVLDIASTVTGGIVPSAGPLGTRPFDAEITAVLRGVNDLKPKPLRVRLQEWQAAGGRLEIAAARLKQGDAVAVAKGDFGLSANGRIDGTLGITLAGFDEFVQSLVGGQGRRSGLLAVAGLSFLGKQGELDGKRSITVPLRFADGAIFFGPIPLGKTAPLY